jgi:hypothetical protein
LSSSPSQGNYDDVTGIWSVGTLSSPPESTILLVNARAPEGSDDYDTTAELTAADQPDPDSTPNNHVSGEDDQATLTVTVSNIP